MSHVMKNNLFSFATGELSQDAFLCWCVNWINDDSKPKLEELSIDLIKKFTGEENIKSVRIYRQFMKIDILFVVNEKIAVIVEDKIHTSEHGDQIQRYKKAIKKAVSNNENDEYLSGIKFFRTVYFKTGFMFDSDKCVESDVVVTGMDFLSILKKYAGQSEIIDSYIVWLENNQKSYIEQGKYDDTVADDFWEWNISNYSIAQYKLMRDIFSEELWTAQNDWRENWLYKVHSGSNKGGRPWTELNIYEGSYKGTSDDYCVFWRIDTDINGPYISLRLYEGFEKKDKIKVERHKKLYLYMQEIIKKIISEGDRYIWEDIYPGYRGNYKEASLIHIKLVNKLRDWKNQRQDFVEYLNQLSNEFAKACSHIEI